MSAHADKTLHWKISGNINDTDTSPHTRIFSLESYSSGINSCMNSRTNSWTNFSNSYEFFARKIGYVTNGLSVRLQYSHFFELSEIGSKPETASLLLSEKSIMGQRSLGMSEH